MDKNVTTIFLSIALSLSFTQFASIHDANSYQWLIFCYFIFRKVSYYAFDLRFADISEDVFKAETKMARMFNFFFGISTLFLFIVTGYFVIDPIKFFFFNSATLFANIGWIVILLIAIDDKKDRNPTLTVKKILNDFIWINIIEIFICVVAGIIIKSEIQINKLTYAQYEGYVIPISLGILFFIFIIDILLHQDFLFDPKYSIKPNHKKAPQLKNLV